MDSRIANIFSEDSGSCVEAEDFLFDAGKIKAELGWRPTCANEEMLYKSYDYYRRHRADIQQRQAVSAHKQAAKMGVIRLLKWLS